MKSKWSPLSLFTGISLFFLLTGCSEDVEPPEASFSYSPSSANTTEPVTFDAEESYPGSCDNCYITQYFWDFDNDGVWDQITDNSTISYQFSSSNIYEVVLKVRNNQGYTSVEHARQTVEVLTSSNGGGITPQVLFPGNGSEDISLRPQLRWSVNDESSNLEFDIYFGTSEDPELVESDYENMSYTPADSLDINTTYFWQIVVRDGEGNEESGSVWQFTTQTTEEEANQPPNKPTAPYPAPLSENRSQNQIVEWQGSDPNGDPLTYEVYFGTSENPTLVETDYSNNTYSHGTLAPATTYYWQVIAFDPEGESAEGELWQFTTGTQDPDCPASFTDVRDNTTYEVVQIGTQCWMAENLQYGEMITSGSAADNGMVEKYCYNNNEDNCDEYGGLYQWDEMMQYTHVEEVGGICPDGWHIPSETEWHRLVDYLGGNFKAGKRLKSGGTSGFEAMLSGTRNVSSGYEGLDLKGYYWSSTELNGDEALQVHFDDNLDGVYYNFKDKRRANSIRCIKN